MARRAPLATMAAVRKACGSCLALPAAIARLPSSTRGAAAPPLGGGDLPAMWQCALCPYAGDSRRHLLAHQKFAHNQRDIVNGCIDTGHCTVCGLLFYDRAMVMTHVFRSEVCKRNLIARGPFLTEAAMVECAAEDARVRRCNRAAGRDQHYAARQCTRIFGPFLPVRDAQGDVIVSPDGHPLGPGRRWHRPAQLG